MLFLAEMINFSDQMTVHPAGLAALVAASLATLFTPRSRMLAPAFVFLFAIPAAQRVVIGGLDFSFARLVIMVGLARVICWPRGARHIKIGWPEATMVVMTLAVIVGSGVRLGLEKGLLAQVGAAIDIAGAFFLARVVIRSAEELKKTLIPVFVLAIPTVYLMSLEASTGRNLFASFGGVNAITSIRDGALRCQGPFMHPILAGLSWALLLPFVWAMFQSATSGIRRGTAAVVALLIGMIVLYTHSSTPIFASGVAMLACWSFPLRRHFKYGKWSMVLLIVMLHFAVDKGAHFLIARVNIISGSTGYHRYKLMDNAINNIGEWWAVGLSRSGHWGYGMQDVTNYYVLISLGGGLVAIVAFVAWLISLMNQVGRSVAVAPTKEIQVWLWAGGCCIGTAALSFISISPFGQSIAIFFLLAGCVNGACAGEFEALSRNHDARRRATGLRRPSRSEPRFPDLLSDINTGDYAH